MPSKPPKARLGEEIEREQRVPGVCRAGEGGRDNDRDRAEQSEPAGALRVDRLQPPTADLRLQHPLDGRPESVPRLLLVGLRIPRTAPLSHQQETRTIHDCFPSSPSAWNIRQRARVKALALTNP